MTANDLIHAARWCVTGIPIFGATIAAFYWFLVVSEIRTTDDALEASGALVGLLGTALGCAAVAFWLASWAVSA